MGLIVRFLVVMIFKPFKISMKQLSTILYAKRIIEDTNETLIVKENQNFNRRRCHFLSRFRLFSLEFKDSQSLFETQNITTQTTAGVNVFDFFCRLLWSMRISPIDLSKVSFKVSSNSFARFSNQFCKNFYN